MERGEGKEGDAAKEERGRRGWRRRGRWRKAREGATSEAAGLGAGMWGKRERSVQMNFKVRSLIREEFRIRVYVHGIRLLVLGAQLMRRKDLHLVFEMPCGRKPRDL